MERNVEIPYIIAEVTIGLEELKTVTQNIPWAIVSGGDQKELRDVFKYKKLSKFFNGVYLAVLKIKLILSKE